MQLMNLTSIFLPIMTLKIYRTLPIKYNRQIENTDTFDMSDVFSICHLVVVEETFGSRLSTKRGYVYATQKLKNFLTQNREFTVQNFVEHFSTTSSTAAKALTRLLKNGLIQKTRWGTLMNESNDIFFVDVYSNDGESCFSCDGSCHCECDGGGDCDWG